jgi:hypothetical protein
MQLKYKLKHNWHKHLRGKSLQREEEKTISVHQPVHTSFTMSNLDTDSSLEPIEITTHFTSLPTGNNNSNHKR